MGLRVVKISVDTAGVAGSAVGTGYSARPLAGEVRALKVDFSASAPGTTDVTVTFDSDDDQPAVTIYAKENSAADVTVYPTVASTDTAGTGRTWYQYVVGCGRIKVALAGCDELTAAAVVTAWVWE